MNKKLFALFGNPVSHSKSPLIHNSAFKHLNIDACYTRYLLEDGKHLREKFLALGLSGVNVTVPFKEDAFEACDKLDVLAQTVGAVNTIVLKEDGELHGFNTDASGFIASLSGFMPKKTLILGAGGTARAIAYPLNQIHSDVCIANRSSSRLDFFEKAGFRCVTTNDIDENESFDLIVNTTSAGLTTDELPCDAEKLRVLFSNAKLVYDCIYKETMFLKMAKELNVESKSGLDMLIWQAFFAFRIFMDYKVDENIVEIMRHGVQ